MKQLTRPYTEDILFPLPRTLCGFSCQSYRLPPKRVQSEQLYGCWQSNCRCSKQASTFCPHWQLFLLVVKPSIAVIVPDGSALEEITEQEEEMLVLVYWHHHQTVLSGDEQRDFKPQIRHVRGGAGQHRQRE